MTIPDATTLRDDLKRLIVESLHLDGLTIDKIADNTPLFGGDLGLDSVDALELIVALEKEYGIKIKSHELDKNVLATVATLSDFVGRSLNGEGDGASPDEQ